eukprot:scaffold42850_cov18-Tisochrysis_lutea.AAC.2
MWAASSFGSTEGTHSDPCMPYSSFSTQSFMAIKTITVSSFFCAQLLYMSAHGLQGSQTAMSLMTSLSALFCKKAEHTHNPMHKGTWSARSISHGSTFSISSWAALAVRGPTPTTYRAASSNARAWLTCGIEACMDVGCNKRMPITNQGK